jgi:hypothetical protein
MNILTSSVLETFVFSMYPTVHPQIIGNSNDGIDNLVAHPRGLRYNTPLGPINYRITRKMDNKEHDTLQ